MSPYRTNVGINHIVRLRKNNLDSLKCKRFNEILQHSTLLGKRVPIISDGFIMNYLYFSLGFGGFFSGFFSFQPLILLK